jgi:hypothetical protein
VTCSPLDAIALAMFDLRFNGINLRTDLVTARDAFHARQYYALPLGL